ncbi:hypothetical protein [Methylobacterium haplocladii]|uniref:hypothetical protein n=1 Tax=Methylobacterium haplocladii TaxID=1176176 RepID=UPI0024E12124|nr:hypothetical protein [Methylobacterium haplocladii]
MREMLTGMRSVASLRESDRVMIDGDFWTVTCTGFDFVLLESMRDNTARVFTRTDLAELWLTSRAHFECFRSVKELLEEPGSWAWRRPNHAQRRRPNWMRGDSEYDLVSGMNDELDVENALDGLFEPARHATAASKPDVSARAMSLAQSAFRHGTDSDDILFDGIRIGEVPHRDIPVVDRFRCLVTGRGRWNGEEVIFVRLQDESYRTAYRKADLIKAWHEGKARFERCFGPFIADYLEQTLLGKCRWHVRNALIPEELCLPIGR